MTKYYLADTDLSALKYEKLSETAGAYDEAQGWVVDKKTSLASPYKPDTKQPSGTFVAEPSVFSALGFRTETALTGDFAAGNWVLNIVVRSNLYYAQKGYVKYRLWRSTNADGSGATQITDGWKSSTLIEFTYLGQYQVRAITWNATAKTLTNEYLFVEVEWYATASGGNNAAEVLFVLSNNPNETCLDTPAFSQPPKVVTDALSLSDLVEKYKFWLTGWAYRKSHVIQAAAGAGTNYQKRITVHYGSGSDGGEHLYLGGKCRSDFADVRFTDTGGLNLLDYWFESKTDGDNAVFWVEVAADLSTADSSIFVYYGNSSASSLSNGDNTFQFYDHFLGSSLDTDKWATAGAPNPTVHDSMLDTTGSTGEGIVCSKWYPAASGAKYCFHYKVGAITGAYFAYVIGPQGGYTANHFMDSIAVGTNADRTYYNNGSGYLNETVHTDVSVVNGDIFEVGFTINSTSWKVYRNDVLSYSPTQAVNLASAGVGFRTYGAGESEVVDYIFVRKWVDPEPAHGGWGSEEEGPNKVILDSLVLSETIAKIRMLQLADSVVSSEALRRDKPLVLALDLLQGSDSVLCQKLLDAALDSLSLGDVATVIQGLRVVTDVIGSFDEVVRGKILTMLDSASLTDLIGQIGKLLNVSETISLADVATLGYIITGVTRDESGAALGGVTLWLFTSGSKNFRGETVSDAATGEYSFDVADGVTEFFIVAFKAGAPDKVGSTYMDLKGAIP